MDLEVDEYTSQSSESSMSKKLKQNEDALASDLGNSTSIAESDLSFHDEDDEDYGDDDDASDYYDDDLVYDDDDDYLKVQSQFDNENLPPGVEASLPWLKDPSPSENMPALISFANLPSLQVSDAVDLPAAVQTSVASIQGFAGGKLKEVATSSSTVSEEENKEEVLEKYESFRRFDTVEEFSDHHYSGAGLSGKQIPDKNWAKKIQEEWRILEKNLPDTIFVRVCEGRMDLLRAVIVGPAGTPYHDGLFTFDALFPPEYPRVPPMIFYYSGGLRLNPNLYDCGKVCLSLLGTWSGREQTENWIPEKSTMLQVLVSIQALILNAQPFFNEPGYDRTYQGEDGRLKSKRYNEEVFILSLKTMVYTIRRPPRHFEDLVIGHFLRQAHYILVSCKAYLAGASIGSVVNENNLHGDAADRSSISFEFKTALSRMMNTMITFFTKNGSKDCEQFRQIL